MPLDEAGQYDQEMVAGRLQKLFHSAFIAAKVESVIIPETGEMKASFDLSCP